MKAFVFCLLLICVPPALADLTPETRASLLDLTKEFVTEKVDEFDKRIIVKYSGPEVMMGERPISALVAWPESDVQDAVFLMWVIRVDDGWKWLRFSDTKMLADGELVSLRPLKLETEVLSGGKVYESQCVELKLEQVLRIVAAETVKMRVGVDEWAWVEEYKIPLKMVLSRWLARGGDSSKYKDLLKLILRPAKGADFADVVKSYGDPIQRNAQSGWALWPGFWARFKDGKVIETKVDRDTRKAAQ